MLLSIGVLIPDISSGAPGQSNMSPMGRMTWSSGSDGRAPGASEQKASCTDGILYGVHTFCTDLVSSPDAEYMKEL